MSKTLFSDLIQRQAKKYGERIALKHRDYKTNTWIPTTWNQFAETVTIVSNALIELGVGVQENIGVFTQNNLLRWISQAGLRFQSEARWYG